MPCYPYYCHDCNHRWEVIKTLEDLDRPEHCQACNSDATHRRIALTNFEKSSVFEPYFEPALGCKIESKSQKARVMREKGVEEVGNESPESMYKNLEVPREKRIASSWDDL